VGDDDRSQEDRVLYIVNSFIFFFIGGLFALGIRTELAQPGLQVVHDELLYNSSSPCTGR
jgi:heme/copper-type cytochrome/quinol oxidase subunit 1